MPKEAESELAVTGDATTATTREVSTGADLEDESERREAEDKGRT